MKTPSFSQGAPRWMALLAMCCALLASHPARAEGDSLLRAATAARAGQLEVCLEEGKKALAEADRSPTRVLVAGCAADLGHVLVALSHLQVVLERALAQREPEVAELARQRVEALLARLGHITIAPPPAGSVTELSVAIDGEPWREGERLVDPGPHRVTATGAVRGVPATFESVVTLAPGAHETITVVLRPTGTSVVTEGQFACLALASSQEEVFRCLPQNARPLVVRAALEMSGYADSLDVAIINPLVKARVSSPARGWDVAASYQVDIISAASPDFVSTASPRGHDKRHAASASASYKPGSIGVDAAGTLSSEADYVARSVGLGFRADVADKRATPRVGYTFSSDTIGRGGTSYDTFSQSLVSHELQAGSSFVMSPQTVLSVGVTAGYERGDPSKPYRLIPMFAPGVVPERGATPRRVNTERLSVRPYEQLPTARDRYAIAGRFSKRLGRAATVRVEERLYLDTWGVAASTTDARVLFDLSRTVTFGPHLRFHAQTGASFYQRVYHATTAPLLTVPGLRTTDRELTPLVTATAGGVLFWAFVPETLTAYVSADVFETRFLDALYTGRKLATYGTLGVEARFE